MKYNIKYYNGTMWLQDGGTFDTFDEATDELRNICNEMAFDDVDDDESFWFSSEIREITE